MAGLLQHSNHLPCLLAPDTRILQLRGAQDIGTGWLASLVVGVRTSLTSGTGSAPVAASMTTPALDARYPLGAVTCSRPPHGGHSMRTKSPSTSGVRALLRHLILGFSIPISRCRKRRLTCGNVFRRPPTSAVVFRCCAYPVHPKAP